MNRNSEYLQSWITVICSFQQNEQGCSIACSDSSTAESLSSQGYNYHVLFQGSSLFHTVRCSKYLTESANYNFCIPYERISCCAMLTNMPFHYNKEKNLKSSFKFKILKKVLISIVLIHARCQYGSCMGQHLMSMWLLQ